MCLAVLAVYCPPSLLDGSQTLAGMDFSQLHTHRIQYAQAALFGDQSNLPAWHSRELLGSPFWSNTQNFPFLPTRLVLLLCDPLIAFPVGVNLAAILAAVFTYLYGRRIGLGPIAAAAAGWTFAVSGFFAARVRVGHLPLLEAYPTLPLLLWLIERCLHAPEGDPRLPFKRLALGLAAACTFLAGHPQLPIYAFAACFLYLMFRGDMRAAVRTSSVMICGVGIAAFALYPMFQLVQRSTRVLRLDEPGNNIFFPYGRLLAFLFPWKDGAPSGVLHTQVQPFHGYPNQAFFWDTVCYVGWLPVLAAAFLLTRRLILRTMPTRPWQFLAIGGFLALVLALPFIQQALSWIPGTILRSPSRQIYLTTLALSLGLGAAVHVACEAIRSRRWPWAWGVLAVGLMAHLADIGSHARSFVRAVPITTKAQRIVPADIAAHVGDGRVAIDYMLGVPWNRQIDDVGFFDSIMLAKSYQATLAINGDPPRLNIQDACGGAFNARVLRYTGVRLVITTTQRTDLPKVGHNGAVQFYSVPDALPRVHFLPQRACHFLGPEATQERLRDQNHDLRQAILLPLPAPQSTPQNLDRPPAANIQYQRESGDRITLQVTTDQSGYVRILEAWDPGWTATVNGQPAEVLCADGAVMAIAAGPETREIRLRFATPGAGTGAAMSVGSLGALVFTAGFFRLRSARPERPGSLPRA